MRWTPAYVALGSNLEGPAAQIERAMLRLAVLPQTRLIARSRLYASRPMGPVDQPDFINAAVALLTLLPAQELLVYLQRIEREMGRVPPPVRWGPRVIDLDLLLFGVLSSNTEELKLPHPGIHERNFVLYPLADIAPTLLVPGRGTVAELAQKLGFEGLRLVTESSNPHT